MGYKKIWLMILMTIIATSIKAQLQMISYIEESRNLYI